jgi:predicted Rossmann fold flavoprotein
VTLLEKGPRPGRKLLVSGSGRCNITNAGPIADFLGRYGERGLFLKKALYAFTNEDLVAWLARRGLRCEAEPGGKIFPVSRKASDVLGILRAECDRGGVRLDCSSPVVGIASMAGIARQEGGGFEVRTRSVTDGERAEEAEDLATSSPEVLTASMVAIATGGRSYPGTGSDGSGYALAASLGHRVVSPRTALTPVIIRDFPLASLAGLSFEQTPMTLRRGGKKLRGFAGDLLITHEGFSGPGILDASRFIEAGDQVEIDFTGLGRESFRESFTAALAEAPRTLVRSLLAGFGLPKRLAERLCELADLGATATSSSLRREARERLVTLTAAFPATVALLGGWDRAMVTAGGVDCAEIYAATMESRLVPGLFFAGEILDVDGDTGGFNLQAAFSTAALAARAMAKRISASA